MKSESGAKGTGRASEVDWPALGPFWKGPKAPQPLPHGPSATSARVRFSRSALGRNHQFQPPRKSMEHRLEEGGGEAGGAGELLAGEGAAVLPEEAGDAEAVGFGELGDGKMEEA